MAIPLTDTFLTPFLKRRVSAKVNNITSSNIFDAYGNTLVTLRIGTDASAITNRIAAYDTAGRLIAETNALNSPTLYTNYFDGSGQLVKQTTSADGGTRIETYYRAGQLQSVTGTAVAPVRYVYGVVSDGGVQRAYSAEIKLDAAFTDTSETVTNFVDMLGRNYKTAYAAASGTPFAISYFNNKGQLTNQVDADGVSQLYAYNPKGEPAYTITDSNRNYTIDYSGNDRISYVTNDVVNNGTADVRRTRVYVWNTSANTSNLVSSVEASADGLRSWNTMWNNGTAIRSQSRTVYDAANGYRYVTNTAPDNSYSVAITRYGTNVSVMAFDSLNTQLSSLNYSYDAHGRPCKFTDARTGTTTNYFNNADQVSGMATPAPSAGEASQVATNYFDVMGRVWKTTLPDTTSVTNEFLLTGQLKKTYGSRTYPVEYTYDAQGRMKTMKTWQNFASGTGAATTTWNYDSYRGWLTNKVYDGGATGPTYTYTTAGRLATRIWARGITTTYLYNLASDLSTVFYSDGTLGVTNGFDRRGRQTSITNGATVCTLAYNDAGQLLSEAYSGGPLNGLIMTNSYDSLLRRTAVGVSNYSATLTTYGYDAASRLLAVTSGTNTATYGYLANSPLVSQIGLTNGSAQRMVTTKSNDYLNRLTSITNLPSAASAIGYRYAYNSANQRTAVTNADNSRWAFSYDSLGQVTGGKKYWSDATPAAGQQFEYAFDDIGNRKTTAAGGDQYGANLRSASYTANAQNQYLNRTVPGYADIMGAATNTATVTVNNQPTYRKSDYFRAELSANNIASSVWVGVTNVAVINNGTNADIVANVTGRVFVHKASEIISRDEDGNQVTDSRWDNYFWDGENRLVQLWYAECDNVSFGYDVQGRRIQKSVRQCVGGSPVDTVTRYLYDGWNLIAILNETNGLLYSFAWGLDASGTTQGAGGVGGLLSMTVHTGTNAGTYFYAYDGNQNIVGLVNATNGQWAAIYEYEPFGRPLRVTGPLAFENPFLFSTKLYDWETGFYYYGYRYYDPSTGRWLSRDPLGERGGPNLYGFVYNSPPNLVDTDGRQSWALSGPGWSTTYQNGQWVYTQTQHQFTGPSGPTVWQQMFGGPDSPEVDQAAWFNQHYSGWSSYAKSYYAELIDKQIQANCGKKYVSNLPRLPVYPYYSERYLGVSRKGVDLGNQGETRFGDAPQSRFSADKVLGAFVFKLDGLSEVSYSDSLLMCCKHYTWKADVVVYDVLGFQPGDTGYYLSLGLNPGRGLIRARWTIEGSGVCCKKIGN